MAIFTAQIQGKNSVREERDFASAEEALAWGHAQKLRGGEFVAYSRTRALGGGYFGTACMIERDGTLVKLL